MAKIFEHFWLKIIAVLLGLLLWFHVATEKTYNYDLNLPITEVVLDSGLTLSEAPPESLQVSISATGKQLMRKKWRDRGLRVMANRLKFGRHELPLTTANVLISSPTSDVNLEDIVFPSHLTLMVDYIGEKKVTVIPDLITEPGEGFAVGKITRPKPNEVTLYGPRNLLSRISSINSEQKELIGLRNNIDLTLPLALPDGYGLRAEPDSVRFSVEIVPVKTRVFENIPIVVYNSPTDKTVFPHPRVINIELTGPPTDIDLLNRNALIASVDYNDFVDSTKVAIKIECPAKFKVKTSTADSARIDIQ